MPAVETVIEVAEVLGMTIRDVARVGATCAVAARGGFTGRSTATGEFLRTVAVRVEAWETTVFWWKHVCRGCFDTRCREVRQIW